MSIIQRIRDKAAWLIFGAIALAMIGFIVTDAFQGRGRGLFNSNSTTIGKVNGNTLEYADFKERQEAQEQRYGGAVNDVMRQNLEEGVWNQMVEEALLKDEYDEMGIGVSDKEVSDLLYGARPPQELAQAFTDPQTGKYDAGRAYQAIQKLKQESPKNYNNFMQSVIDMRKREKYFSLLENSYYLPKWMVEKANADNSQLANISYVYVPYSSIPDSTIKVTDEDLKEFMNKRPDEFKQEASRTISYVTFSTAPSAKDTAYVLDQMNRLKPQFDTTSDYQSFLAANGSETNYYDGFITDTNVKRRPGGANIRTLANGQVYGPFQDEGTFVMAKMIDKRTMPDTATIRHILIGFNNGAVPDSVAKRRADSVAAVIKAGADFTTVAAAVTDDKQGFEQNKGVYVIPSLEFTRYMPEFSQAAFFGNKGDKKVIKTDYGYHYIEVVDQKNIQPAYKVAYFTKAIVVSNETMTTASGRAAQFSGLSRNKKAFDENAKKQNLTPLVGGPVRPTDNTVPNLGSNRQFVRWIFDAKIGDVSEQFEVGDQYVVAVVTDITEEGMMKPEKARPLIEGLIRNKKKGEQLRNKIGNVTTLEAAASATGRQVARLDSVSFNSPSLANLGYEPRVVGAAFNKAWLNKVTPPIVGIQSLWIIRPEAVYARPNAALDIQQLRQSEMLERRGSVSFRTIEGMKKAATIKDRRAKFL